MGNQRVRHCAIACEASLQFLLEDIGQRVIQVAVAELTPQGSKQVGVLQNKRIKWREVSQTLLDFAFQTFTCWVRTIRHRGESIHSANAFLIKL